MNHPLYFELQVDDLARARAFYEAIFQWKFILQDGLPIEYYRIETDGIAGGMLARPAAIKEGPSGTNAAVISMEVADFDATAALILSNGGIVAMEKFAIHGKCWQGYFQDGERNTFGIFEVDEHAS